MFILGVVDLVAYEGIAYEGIGYGGWRGCKGLCSWREGHVLLLGAQFRSVQMDPAKNLAFVEINGGLTSPVGSNRAQLLGCVEA